MSRKTYFTKHLKRNDGANFDGSKRVRTTDYSGLALMSAVTWTQPLGLHLGNALSITTSHCHHAEGMPSHLTQSQVF